MQFRFDMEKLRKSVGTAGVLLFLQLGTAMTAAAEPIRDIAASPGERASLPAASSAPGDPYLGLAPEDAPALSREATYGRTEAAVLQALGSPLPRSATSRGMADLGTPGISESEAVSGTRDLLRSYLNTQGSTGPATGARRDAARAPIGLGALPEDDWVHVALEDLVTSILRPSVNERGEASFSMLGFGEFGLMLSGDRSRLTLVSGDDVLLAAERVEAVQATRSPDRAREQTAAERDEWVHHGLPITRSGGQVVDADPTTRLKEIVAELLTHPITVLAFALVIGYFLLSSVLKYRASRPHRRARRSASRRASARPDPVRRASRGNRSRRRSSRHSTSPSTHRA